MRRHGAVVVRNPAVHMVRRWRHLLLVAGLLIAGCAAVPPADIKSDSLVLSRNLEHGKAAWVREARRRFENPFVFVCHGDTSDGKTWQIAPDDARAQANIEAVGLILHRLMPDRDIILVSCNHAGLKPRLPRRVWYATKTVWSIPQRSFPWAVPGYCESDVFGFIEGDGR